MNVLPNSPGNLFTIVVYYFEVADVDFGMIVGHTVLVNSIVMWLLCSLNLFSKHHIISFWTGLFVDNVLFTVWWIFIFGVHYDGFKGVGSFEDDLYTGILEDSSEFFT